MFEHLLTNSDVALYAYECTITSAVLPSPFYFSFPKTVPYRTTIKD